MRYLGRVEPFHKPIWLLMPRHPDHPPSILGSFWTGLLNYYKVQQAWGDLICDLEMILKNWLVSFIVYRSHLKKKWANCSSVCSDFTALQGNVTVPNKLYVSMAVYRVVVMASKQIFLAFPVFNYYFLLSEHAEFWPCFVPENWAASCHSQTKMCLTIQAGFLRYTHISGSSIFAFIIKKCELWRTETILNIAYWYKYYITSFCVAVWKTLPTTVIRLVLDILYWELRRSLERGNNGGELGVVFRFSRNWYLNFSKHMF